MKHKQRAFLVTSAHEKEPLSVAKYMLCKANSPHVKEIG